MTQLQSLLAALSDRTFDAAGIAACIDFAHAALRDARPDLAVPLLEALTRREPAVGRAWQLLGFAYRDLQRMAEATDAFARAAGLCPEDASTALGFAETRAATGLPAAHLFRIALRLVPEHPPALRGLAQALIAEGGTAEAEQLLEAAVVRRPDWLEGHKCLADLRWISGDTGDFARSYREACRLQPSNRALRLAWFAAVAQARDWDGARAIVLEGERLFGAAAAFTVARIFIACESGDLDAAERLFAATADLQDGVRDIAEIRHCLRTGQPDRAERVALRLVDTPLATTAWPYLSLIWRLRGDARAQWLDGAPPYVRAVDLDLSAAQWEELAALLRRLHTARAPYLDQSVRGGTQTHGQLFFRPEPIVQVTKSKVEAAIRDYAAALPPAVPGHPLLGTARADRVLFSGSWSVRLLGSGYHVSHTHPMGWISSALYVALPPSPQLGAPPAGWIRFGAPPPELGLDLPSYQDVEPRPGRLVLFPSTMWHRTLPFESGERLVVAFDVRRPSAPRPRAATAPVLG